jgi:hypothetical protein
MMACRAGQSSWKRTQRAEPPPPESPSWYMSNRSTAE